MTINRKKQAELNALENQIELLELKAERMVANGFHKSAANLLMQCAAKRVKIEQVRNNEV